MFHRLLELPRRSCLLLGPRQTGKTTLVRQSLAAGAWAIDLFDHAVALRYARDPGLFRAEAAKRIGSGTRTIFVDEVQKVPEILDAVHSLIEETGARFILTGSSARKLRRGGANLLAGRASIRHLHPLTSSEVGSDFDLERALRFGTLPPVVTQDDATARDILRAYADTYLREEIQAEALVRNIGGFARFLDVAAAQSGELLSFSGIARDAALPVKTVQNYFEILEDTLLGFRLEAWRASPRGRMVAHPRFYMFDPGITNALTRRLGAELDAGARGRLFEQWIVLECHRLIDYAQSEARIFFWRTNTGAEVDLLVERHGKLLLACEIKGGRRISGADLSGLRSFAEAHPKVPRIVVANVPEPFDLAGAEVLPWKLFLERFARHL